MYLFDFVQRTHDAAINGKNIRTFLGAMLQKYELPIIFASLLKQKWWM
jgi:hypothetical protein